jgi:hypothetical protein
MLSRPCRIGWRNCGLWSGGPPLYDRSLEREWDEAARSVPCRARDPGPAGSGDGDRQRRAVLYAIGLFGFIWVVLNPANGVVATAQRGSLGTALGLFIGFGLVSVLFWAFFRFRLSR